MVNGQNSLRGPQCILRGLNLLVNQRWRDCGIHVPSVPPMSDAKRPTHNATTRIPNKATTDQAMIAVTMARLSSNGIVTLPIRVRIVNTTVQMKMILPFIALLPSRLIGALRPFATKNRLGVALRFTDDQFRTRATKQTTKEKMRCVASLARVSASAPPLQFRHHRYHGCDDAGARAPIDDVFHRTRSDLELIVPSGQFWVAGSKFAMDHFDLRPSRRSPPGRRWASRAFYAECNRRLSGTGPTTIAEKSLDSRIPTQQVLDADRGGVCVRLGSRLCALRWSGLHGAGGPKHKVESYQESQ